MPGEPGLVSGSPSGSTLTAELALPLGSQPATQALELRCGLLDTPTVMAAEAGATLPCSMRNAALCHVPASLATTGLIASMSSSQQVR
jgi:hypothetical protein